MPQVTDEQTAHEAARQIKKLFEYVSQSLEVFDEAAKARSRITQLMKDQQKEREKLDKIAADRDGMIEVAQKEVDKLRSDVQTEIAAMKKKFADDRDAEMKDMAARREAATKELSTLQSHIDVLSKQRSDLAEKFRVEVAGREQVLKNLEAQRGQSEQVLADLTAKVKAIRESIHGIPVDSAA